MTEFMIVHILIVVVASVGVVETVAILTWLPLYFRRGIPLYVRKVIETLPNSRHDLMDLVSCSQTGLLFHRLSSHEVAFREPLLTFTRMPVMHGRVLWDGSSVHVKGLANWSFVALGICFFAVGSMFLIHEPIFAILMLATFICVSAWAYDLQRQRFNDLVLELSARLKPPA